ncbi:MAG: binding domain protein [Kosmotoga sp.]|uniref:RNA binding S1 domain protein n=1 Tax=Kosmotoga olearia (strain ATCC BAA-1733 / DSM 21960 / TBF 19.5.1) TaxID=521045 RepID=C5CIS6_KOSOT|nr:S1 RNA-binding domain-containing protein [Kosmotoga olearia]ACR78968.1 RNA binding S1 domain protein [Kosmotoga olearia TBF 19.5.1]MDK2953408.1 binding domain protein [Kosmotoga sp.]
MSVKVGNIVQGKVTAVRKYGAFVTLEGGEEGFIHISKVSKGYVKNIDDYLKVGQEITAKVLGTTKDGKWELSIKDAGGNQGEEQATSQDFERKLARFMRDSSQKLSAYRRRLDKKRGVKKR